MVWTRRRAWWTGHDRNGFHLSVIDRRLDVVLAEAAVHGVIAVLGHPCRERGLGRIPYLDVLAFRFLNLPNHLARHDVRVLEIPLTVEQVLALDPSWDDWNFWREEEKEETL